MSAPLADLTRETLATIRRTVVEARDARAHYVKNLTSRDAAMRLEKANVAYGLVAETYLEYLLEMASRCVTVETLAKLAKVRELADEAYAERQRANYAQASFINAEALEVEGLFHDMVARDLAAAADDRRVEPE